MAILKRVRHVSQSTSPEGPIPSGVLNPVLYGQLRRAFGEVEVSLLGEVPVRDQMGLVISGGEKYRVDCPYCGDSNKHLWVSPLWGIPSEPPFHGAHWSWVKCYRRDCLDPSVDLDRSNLKNLRMRVFESFGDMTRHIQNAEYLSKLKDVRREVDTGPVDFPGVCVKLSDLEPGHQALTYLEEVRGFDVQELEELWDPRYCVQHDGVDFAAIDRLIVPMYQGGEMLTWQGRVVDPESTRPKYYNRKGSQKNRVLYGCDIALDFNMPFAVVVEGLTDVWRLGPGGVASLGKSLSPAQTNLLLENWGSAKEGAVFLFVDGDDEKAMSFAERNRAKLLDRDPDMRISTLVVEGKDPGDLTREEAWGHVQASANRDRITFRR